MNQPNDDARTLEEVPVPSEAERAVADLLPVGAHPLEAARARDAVAVWFHTFQLAPGVYTPGIARDHRYRLPALGAERFRARRVLDVGSFDGFYAFLAEARGAQRVVAVDNEQYVDWVRGRFGVQLEPGGGFRAVQRLLGSRVEYRRLDAMAVGGLGESFDLVLCFGMLHRVTDPISTLRSLGGVLAPGGEILVETYGSRLGDMVEALEVHEPGGVYAGDDFVYWGFTPKGLQRIATLAGLGATEVVDQVEVDGHPRLIALLSADR